MPLTAVRYVGRFDEIEVVVDAYRSVFAVRGLEIGIGTDAGQLPLELATRLLAQGRQTNEDGKVDWDAPSHEIPWEAVGDLPTATDDEE